MCIYNEETKNHSFNHYFQMKQVRFAQNPATTNSFYAGWIKRWELVYRISSEILGFIQNEASLKVTSEGRVNSIWERYRQSCVVIRQLSFRNSYISMNHVIWYPNHCFIQYTILLFYLPPHEASFPLFYMQSRYTKRFLNEPLSVYDGYKIQVNFIIRIKNYFVLILRE